MKVIENITPIGTRINIFLPSIPKNIPDKKVKTIEIITHLFAGARNA